MKIRNLTEESTTPEDIAHIARNAYVGKIEDRSYTRNTKPTQNPRYYRSSYSKCYDRYKDHETKGRYRNHTYLESNKKTLIVNSKGSEEDHITQDNKVMQMQVK